MFCYSHNIQQIDIAPTLAVLLGIPYPSSSIGRLIPGLLEILSPIRLLNTLKTYYIHLRDLVEISSGHNEELYIDANRNFKTKFPEFVSKSVPQNITDEKFVEFRDFLIEEGQSFSKHLMSKRTHFDMNYLWLAIAILWTTTVS